MLLYIGMADAYGMAAEYLKFPRDNAVRAKCLRFAGYVKHPTHQEHPGMYTDDTEMSAANTRVLIDGAPFDKLKFARAYVAEFERGGQRKGYSQNFQALLEQTRSGEQLLAKLIPNSDKNGAAMRSVPFGVIPDLKQMLEVAALQASITHDTPVGRFSARAVALMSHFALYEDRPLAELGDYCTFHLKEGREYLHVFRKPWPNEPVKTSDRHGPVGLTTVWAVAHLVMQEHSLKDMLMRAIEWGGDVDSVAAIAWGIASCRFRSEPLPDFLSRDLERGNPHTGADYLIDLGTRLMAKYA